MFIEDGNLLTNAAKAKDLNALSMLFDRYSAALYRYALHLSQNSSQANTIVDQVYARLASQLATGRVPAGHLRSYLFKSAYYLAFDQQRKSTGSLVAAKITPPMLMDLPNRVALEKVYVAIHTELSSEQQQAVVLHFLEGLSQPETADIIGEDVDQVILLQKRAVTLLCDAIYSPETPLEEQDVIDTLAELNFAELTVYPTEQQQDCREKFMVQVAGEDARPVVHAARSSQPYAQPFASVTQPKPVVQTIAQPEVKTQPAPQKENKPSLFRPFPQNWENALAWGAAIALAVELIFGLYTYGDRLITLVNQQENRGVSLSQQSQGTIKMMQPMPRNTQPQVSPPALNTPTNSGATNSSAPAKPKLIQRAPLGEQAQPAAPGTQNNANSASFNTSLEANAQQP